MRERFIPPPPPPSPLRQIVRDLCAKNGHAINRDVQAASGASSKCVYKLLDRMLKEGCLFRRKISAGINLFFTDEAAAIAYVVPPKQKRVRQPKPAAERKKPGRKVGSQDSKPRKVTRGRPITIMQPIGKAQPGFSRAQQQLGAEQIVIGLDKPPIVGPVGYDHRFTVRELPKDYRSQINPQEARPWTRYVEARA